MFYISKESIKLVDKASDDEGNGYNTLKAYDCIVEPIRIELPYYLPIFIKLRLLYLPKYNRILKITYTGNGYERIIENMTDEVLPNKLLKREFVKHIKLIPFDFIRCLLKDLKNDNDEYINEWCRMVKINFSF